MSRFQKVLFLKIAHAEQVTERVYDQPTLLIGRSTDVQIGISDPGVSRSHLEISLKQGRVWLTDLGSANGTFINGKRIVPKTKTAYSEGETINVGSQRISVSISVIEKAFDLKSVEASDLDSNEKENLMTLVHSAHAEADRISHMAKAETDQSIRATEAKINNLITQANFQADQIISTANNNASQIIEEAQKKHRETVMRAEKDAMDASSEVFRRAEQTKIDAQEKAQQILSEADASAQEKYNKAGDEATQLLQQARQGVQDLRIDWEAEMATLAAETRTRAYQAEDDAKLRAEEIISTADRQKLIVLNQANEFFDTAKKEAQERSAQYYAQAEAELKATQKKAQEIIIEAHQEAKNIHSLSERETQQKKSDLLQQANDLIKRRADDSEATLQKRMAETGELIRCRNEENDQQLSARQKEFETGFSTLTANLSLTQKEFEVQKDKLESVLKDKKSNEQVLTEILQEVKYKNAEIQNFKNEKVEVETAKEKLFIELSDFKVQLATTMEQRKTAIIEADQVKQEAERFRLQAEKDSQELKDQARKEIEAFKVRESEHLDKAKLDEIKKMKEIRLEADRSLNRHRSELVNEFLRLTESHVLSLIKPSLPSSFDWTSVSRRLQSEVKDELNEAVYKFTNVEGPVESIEIVQQKSNLFIKRFKTVGLSAAAAIFLVMIIPTSRHYIFNIFREDPANSGATIFSKQMQDERARRFTPTKTDDWRDNYTDALLYTQGFTDLKLDPKYQDKWIRDLHEYLYTKLRVDEDSIVKLVSLEAAMVTKLKEEADTIHPDYVDQQVKKMRAMETETVAKMQKIIGSESKYEKFRKFSEDYYYNEYLKRTPAQNRQ